MTNCLPADVRASSTDKSASVAALCRTEVAKQDASDYHQL